jgi:hypothetical protein
VNLQCARIGLLAYVVGIMALGCTSVFALRLASGQTNHASTYDPLKAFVGTWTAKNPNETKPYLFLKVSESHGKLTATISHFKMGVVGNGKIFGDPGMPGESSLADLTVSSGDLEFVWAGDPPLHGGQAKFVLEGTEVACLLISVSEEESLKMMADNHARGFNPIIWMRRLGDTAPAPNSEAEASRSTAMAMLINTAEEQYRFTHGNYADYPTLVRSGQLEKTAGHEFTFLPRGLQSSETDALAGYVLRLLVSPDRNSYQLSIWEKTEADCGRNIFSDERGFISEGRVLGCPANQ